MSFNKHNHFVSPNDIYFTTVVRAVNGLLANDAGGFYIMIKRMRRAWLFEVSECPSRGYDFSYLAYMNIVNRTGAGGLGDNHRDEI